jgi:hypothetical protein
VLNEKCFILFILQEIEMVEQDFVNEKKSAVREFEDQKIYLRDQVKDRTFLKDF